MNLSQPSIGSNTSNLQCYNLPKEVKDNAIQFQLAKALSDSFQPYQLHARKPRDVDYGSNIIKFFKDIFANTAWSPDVTKANKPSINLGEEAPDSSIFELFKHENGPTAIEHIEHKLPTGTFHTTHTHKNQQDFLDNFPHRSF